ncbi:2-oxo-3-hexenedioate decarboxylase [Oceanospirillum beijerinckii]|uniref:2-oxo-3-hexenedioate decarboxylase n=1 Tax=Oceanospirillum beijerinckii TaxID=64976 RepID=UPI000429C8C9|nr:2-oxo-3-hexenedioate decarboxylase [Oceanospirillum beijerinckii]
MADSQNNTNQENQVNNLTQQQIEELAIHCENAELEAYEITKITDDFPQMTYKDAFDIQWEARRRKEARGTKIVGMKMGLTSWAKMAQMGVEHPCYGYLADYFSVPEGGDIKTDELIHPKIEAEIAFVTKAPLKGPGVHIGDVLRATDFIVPAVEVIDSRYKDFKFDLKSVIADNSSSTRFITGGCMAQVDEVDLKTLGVVMEINGEIVATGAGAAVLGHPAASVAMLANMMGERGEEIPAGTFIMTGGITAAVTVNKGDNINVRYQGLGSISARFV